AGCRPGLRSPLLPGIGDLPLDDGSRAPPSAGRWCRYWRAGRRRRGRGRCRRARWGVSGGGAVRPDGEAGVGDVRKGRVPSWIFLVVARPPMVVVEPL